MMPRMLALSSIFAVLLVAPPAQAEQIGQIKVSKGTATVERDGQVLPATVGLQVRRADVVRTGRDGSVGLTMSDSARLSLGPNSVLSLDSYQFDAATHAGAFDASLRSGSMAVVSGSIAKQSPDAMVVRTPYAVLGVRGTEFVVSANDPYSLRR